MWQQRDPIDRLEKQLREAAILYDRTKANIESRIAEELESDLQFAIDSPFPQPEAALKGVYSQPAVNKSTSS